MGELSNTTINGVSYDFKDAGAARQSHSHTKSQITDFPTSMPASDVSAWAKASTKPTYTASEVGAVPNTSAGVSAAINLLSTGDSAPTDNDYYVSQYSGGGTSTTTYHRRPVSKLWEYIKSKLASKGSATQPVYFSNGVPVATTYTLGKSVPSDAKFTDTTYSAATTSAAGLMSATDKSKLDGLPSPPSGFTKFSTLPSSSITSDYGGFANYGPIVFFNALVNVPSGANKKFTLFDISFNVGGTYPDNYPLPPIMVTNTPFLQDGGFSIPVADSYAKTCTDCYLQVDCTITGSGTFRAYLIFDAAPTTKRTIGINCSYFGKKL